MSYAFTSSEEVGTRGAKTAARVAEPDVCIVLDVACNGSEFVRDHTNNRQLGKGPMIVHYDKTVVSNRRAGGAGTPQRGGTGHTGAGRHVLKRRDRRRRAPSGRRGHPTVVLGIPTRYGHSPYSIGCYRDMEQMVELLERVLDKLDAPGIQKNGI